MIQIVLKALENDSKIKLVKIRLQRMFGRFWMIQNSLKAFENEFNIEENNMKLLIRQFSLGVGIKYHKHPGSQGSKFFKDG